MVAPEAGNASLPTIERQTGGISRRCEVLIKHRSRYVMSKTRVRNTTVGRTERCRWWIDSLRHHIISHHLTAPLTLPIPTSSPDASSTMLTNWLMINNYYNYYFFVFLWDASDRHFTYFISIGFHHFSYVIIAAFCQLCLINIIIIFFLLLLCQLPVWRR